MRSMPPPGFLLGASGDPLVWTPGAVKAELNRVRISLDTVNAEVSEAAKDGRVSNQEWLLWKDFYTTSHKSVDKATTLFGSSVDSARQLEQQALRWRDLVKERSKGTGKVYKSVGPTKLAPAGSAADETPPLFATSTKLIFGGLLLGLGYVFFNKKHND